MREVWNSAGASVLGSPAFREKRVFCDYLAAAGSHTQKAGFATASHLFLGPTPSIVHHSASIQALAFGARHT